MPFQKKNAAWNSIVMIKQPSLVNLCLHVSGLSLSRFYAWANNFELGNFVVLSNDAHKMLTITAKMINKNKVISRIDCSKFLEALHHMSRVLNSGLFVSAGDSQPFSTHGILSFETNFWWMIWCVTPLKFNY